MRRWRWGCCGRFCGGWNIESIDYLRELAAVAPDRASASANEGKAAVWIAERLRAMGYTVSEQTFATTRDNLYLMPAQVFTCAIAAGWLALAGHRWLAALVLAYGIALLLMEVSGYPHDVSTLPRFQSRNVYTEPSAPSAETIFVTAHYDTQRGSFLFHPRFVPYLAAFFNFCYGGLLVVVIGVASGSGTILHIGLAVSIAALAVFLLAELTGRYTPGGNDNGSGVALALFLAEDYARHRSDYPAACQIRFVFTGSEETGERGMKAFLRAHRGSLDRQRTLFVNLDNLGTGRLTFLSGEGLIFYRRAGKRLLEAARAMGQSDERKNLLLPTDALPASTLGFEAISFLGLEKSGHPGNYHWHTDTVDRMDAAFLRFQQGFFKDYLIRVMGQTQP